VDLKKAQNEYRISNKECRIMKFSFDIRYSLFDILRFKKSSQIQRVSKCER